MNESVAFVGRSPGNRKWIVYGVLLTGAVMLGGVCWGCGVR